MTTRSKRDSEQTWNCIVEAARDTLIEGGLERFSLRGVAKRAGYGLATLQYYFPKKTDLLEETLGEGRREVSEFVASSAEQIRQGADFETVAQAMIVEYFRCLRRHPKLCRAYGATSFADEQVSASTLRELEHNTRVLARAAGKSIHKQRLSLGLYTVTTLVVRYASHSEEGLREVTGAKETGEALSMVEAHLRGAALEVFRHARAE